MELYYTGDTAMTEVALPHRAGPVIVEVLCGSRDTKVLLDGSLLVCLGRQIKSSAKGLIRCGIPL